MAASDYTNVVQQLYIAYFGRPADYTGLHNLENALNSIGAPNTINDLATAYSTNSNVKFRIDNFGTSPESTVLYSGNAINFVNAIYLNLFGRQADFAGLTFWSNAVNSGAVSKGAAALNIMAGALTNTSAQGLIDAAVIANKVTVAANFTDAIDTTAEILAYSGDSAAATARAMLAKVSSTTDPAAFQTSVTSTLSDLVTTYNTAAVAGSTFTLTTKPDTFTGTAKNDTFNAADSTFTSLDTIDGGKGNDVLNIASTSVYGFSAPTGASVTNIETVNITSSAGVTIDTTSGWTGLTALNVVDISGATVTSASTTAIAVTNSTQGGDITVDGGSTVAVTATGATGSSARILVGATTAAAGAVTISSTAQAMSSTHGGAITVNGGTTVSITSLNAGAGVSVGQSATQGNVSVTGNSSTTEVTVIQSGRVAAANAVGVSDNTNNAVAGVKGNTVGSVTITDANADSTTAVATIKTVTLQNYADSTISSNQLSTLTLSSTGLDTTGAANIIGTLMLYDYLDTKIVTELTLNLGGGSLGDITDTADKFTTVNVVMTADTKLKSFADTALQTLAISGTGVLSLTDMNTYLASITVAGAAGFKGNLSDATHITSFTAANTTGNNTVTLNATTQTYTGGSGNDKIIISTDATKVITGGAGIDTLVLNASADTFTHAKTGTNVTGFEVLVAGNNASGTFDVSALGGAALTKLQASASVTFSKVTVGTVLELVTSGAVVNYQTSDTHGENDTVTVMLAGASADRGTGTTGYTTQVLTLQDANQVGIGTVNIVTDASVGGGIHNIGTLNDSALSRLNITGTGALGIDALTTSATTFTVSDNDTSTATSSIGTLTAANLANISYSGTHAFDISTLDNNTVTTLVITNVNTGSTGVLSVGIAGFTNDSLTSLTLNGSIEFNGNFESEDALTVSGATNNQNVCIYATHDGIKTITLGNGGNTITTGYGADVITLGSGANSVTGGNGGDSITFAAHTGKDVVQYTLAGQTASGTVASGSTVLTAANGYDIYTGLQAGDQIDLQDLTHGKYTAGTLGTTLNGATGGTIVIVRGSYVASSGIFTANSTGADSIVQWDSDGTDNYGNTETIVLVGFVNSGSTTTSDGLITLA